MQIKVSPFGSLAEAQRHAMGAIDEAAESARLRYLSPGAGQSMEYEEAYRQARLHQLDPNGEYPMLAADVAAGLTESVADAASVVLEKRKAWEVVGQRIRELRLCAKRRVREASTTTEVVRIRIAAVQELEGV